MKTYNLIACTFLAALAFILQVSNDVLGIPTGFGMTIDLAAVPIMVALFVFGAEYAFITLMVLGAIILISSPTGVVGSVMKLGATLPMIIIPYYVARSKTALEYAYVLAGTVLGTLALFYLTTEIYSFLKGGVFEYFVGLVPIAILVGLAYAAGKGKEKADLSNTNIAAFALLLAIITRGMVAIVANLYFAGPVFFHISAEAFLELLNSLELPLLGSGMGPFVIFFWNAVLGIIEFTVAWMLAYRFGLAKRYGEG